MKMEKLFPEDYRFFPRTWLMPGDMQDFKTRYFPNNGKENERTFIVKPEAMC